MDAAGGGPDNRLHVPEALWHHPKQTAAILFLASDEAGYITGVTLPVAGGDLG